MGEGEYVLGLEPCNCVPEGRVKAKEMETLEYIEPGECRGFNIRVEFLAGEALR